MATENLPIGLEKSSYLRDPMRNWGGGERHADWESCGNEQRSSTTPQNQIWVKEGKTNLTYKANARVGN